MRRKVCDITLLIGLSDVVETRVSHTTFTSKPSASHPEQMAPFVALVTADADFTTSLVPVGNGEFLAVKAAR
jgi:hypothetical protein